MALVYENDCVDCPKEIGCFGMACPNKNVPHYYCDGKDCGEEFEPSELYDFYGDMLCKDCLAKQFDTIG